MNMWNTNSLWLEVAVVSTITAAGGFFFNHFEERTPPWRRLVKFLLLIFATTTISATAGRVWAFTFLGGLVLFALFIHGIWLPRKGINGLTGEPKDKYYELRGWKKKAK